MQWNSTIILIMRPNLHNQMTYVNRNFIFESDLHYFSHNCVIISIEIIIIQPASKVTHTIAYQMSQQTCMLELTSDVSSIRDQSKIFYCVLYNKGGD